MKPDDIVTFLKDKYNRDVRKQIVKSIVANEKNNDKESLERSYLLINKIFSYVISQLEWNISNNSSSWDDTPLKVMCEVFPKFETTKWYSEQLLQAKNSIKLQGEL